MSMPGPESDRLRTQPRCQLAFLSREPMDRIITRAHKALIVFGGFYVLSVAFLAIPLVQRQ